MHMYTGIHTYRLSRMHTHTHTNTSHTDTNTDIHTHTYSWALPHSNYLHAQTKS